MRLDPQVEQLLVSISKLNLPPITQLTPAEARQRMLDTCAVLGVPEDVDSIEDRTISGRDVCIPVRIYKPGGETRAVVVYLHGGGWVIGSVETHDGYCRALANAASSVVVSVDYRLAPEHKFPAAAEDCYDATRWTNENLGRIASTSSPLIVAGDSAGGNLATAVALMARDRGGPSIAKQILIYPITDHDFDVASYKEFADGYFLTRDAMMWFWDLYCTSQTDRSQPYLSPLRADNLQHLPPALIMTAEFDPLRDEGTKYADKLVAAGIDVTLTQYDGMIHGFTRRLNLFDQARAALKEVADAIIAAANA